ncbi:MAG: hypothetical protein DME06_13385 [Candidatus Rokuibacteriota bacterium]|nr:MAG: hypothetical protein DME09_13355 [Candidatus Rokubacteria bacterium]PYN10781.1 MAG: hypothetical protein DME06_13385 [Candidatus Rokubacteria bacterium]
MGRDGLLIGLGFRLDEIKEIVAIRRSGRVPCSHVRALVWRKLADVDRAWLA